jgi:hypothetical protein
METETIYETLVASVNAGDGKFITCHAIVKNVKPDYYIYNIYCDMTPESRHRGARRGEAGLVTA